MDDFKNATCKLRNSSRITSYNVCYTKLLRDESPESVEAGMACNVDMIDIVHCDPAYPSIIPLKAHGLDKVHSRPQAGTQAENGADVYCNFRFEKGNSHSG